jgi:hypothetical protein
MSNFRRESKGRIVCFLDFHSTACIRNFGTITTFSIICRLSDNYSLCQTNPFFFQNICSRIWFLFRAPLNTSLPCFIGILVIKSPLKRHLLDIHLSITGRYYEMVRVRL